MAPVQNSEQSAKPSNGNNANASRKRNWSSTTQSTPQTQTDKSRIVAIDCEFVGVGPKNKSALGRCSIVNYWGEIVLECYSKPREPITDFRTPYSGLRRRHMANAVRFDIAQGMVKEVLRDKIVVGHAIHNDINVLMLNDFIDREMIRDTSTYEPLRTMAGITNRNVMSLKNLTKALLGRDIQTGEHDSIEDARATMDLYKKVEHLWEQPRTAAASSSQKRARLEGQSNEDSNDDEYEE